MIIWCCGCQNNTDAKLTNGKEIYPHRKDLYNLKFWKCDTCQNYVGCHKNNDKAIPLGNIPTPEIRKLRIKIHDMLDPLWKNGKIKRGEIYRILSEKLKIDSFHTSEIKSIEDANKVIELLRNMVS